MGTGSSAREYHFIVNPRSGRAKMRTVLQEVLRRLLAEGCRCTVRTTEYAGHAKTLATQTPSHATAVVAVGGDGTVREIVEGLLGRDIALAVLPTGTENLFAKQVRLEPTAECLSEALLNGVTRRIDVGKCGEKVFLVVGGVGFDAEVVERLTRSRKGHISRLDYFWPIWRTFWDYRFPSVTLKADGEVVFTGAGLVIFGNMPRYGGGLRILPDASCEDGLIDVCIFACENQLQLLGHAARVVFRRHRRSPRCFYLQAKQIQISSGSRLGVQLDGDLAGELPLTVHLIPQALRVLVPRESC